MTPPTAAAVHVATEALRGDARVWAQQSDALGTAAVLAQGLAMNRLEAGIFQVMVGAYGEVLDHVVARCDEGRAVTARVSETLGRVAATYEDEDVRHVHAFRHLH